MKSLSIDTISDTDIKEDHLATLLSNNTFVGIDFGTSTSIASIIVKEGAKLTTRELKIDQKTKYQTTVVDYIVPTVIALYNKYLLVGKGADDLKFSLRKDIDVFYNFKMDLGEQNVYSGSHIPAITTPKDALQLFLSFLKSRILDICLKEGLSQNLKFSFSIPASFEANQRNEFLDALKENQIDITHAVLIDEPNAAFISYIKDRFEEGEPIRLPSNKNLNFLVFDFGAGTCDVSLIEVGYSFDGIFSKNIAISKFEKIGGRDIDKAIAQNFLLHQFFLENNLTNQDFSAFEIEDIIIPALLKTAENLKIEICNNISLLCDIKNTTLPPKATSDESITLRPSIIIETTKGKYNFINATLSYKDFNSIMSSFSSEKNLPTSFLNPIMDVLKKSNMGKKDIFAVLFIGGSSKNPYVQNVISQYFSYSEKLIPKNLQSHVSKGAAINSLFQNGFGKTILRQITSNSLFIETRSGQIPLVTHGTEIPCPVKKISTELVTWRDGQEIKLPIYSHDAQLLYEILLIHPSGDGFSDNTLVDISYHIDINKNLTIFASAGEETLNVRIENPFYSGSSLNAKQQRIIQLERKLANEKQKGMGLKETYKELVDAFDDDGQHHLAAKTMEEAILFYKNLYSYNDIAIMYSNSNDKKNAIRNYDLALESDPESAIILSNKCMHLSDSDPLKLQLLNQALDYDPSYEPALIMKARLIKSKEPSKARDLEEKAFNSLYNRFLNKNISNSSKSWLINIANTLGKSDVLKKLKIENNKQDLFDNRVEVKGGIIHHQNYQ